MHNKNIEQSFSNSLVVKIRVVEIFNILKSRETIRFEIKELQKQFNFTIIFVTHDQSEAMAISDRMCVMDMGEIVQIGTPIELYNKPKNHFVHSFLGDSTFTPVKIDGGRAYIQGNPDALAIEVPADAKPDMLLATRPNTIEINHEQGCQGKVVKRIFLTNFTEYLVKIGNQVIRVQAPHRVRFNEGETCYLRFPSAMWYEPTSQAEEAERNKRQLI